MGWGLLELQAETGLKKRTIHKILGKDFHLRKIVSKWVSHSLTEVEKMDTICNMDFLKNSDEDHITRAYLSFFLSLLLPFWRAVRSYRPHLEGRDPIWGDDWSQSPFIRWSPSWGFLGFSSAVRQMPGDLYTAPRIISLSPLSLATDVTDTTLGVSGPIARNPDKS